MTLTAACRASWSGLFALSVTTLQAGLPEYVHKADPSYAWELAGKSEGLGASVYELRLISQTWQGIAWKHNLNIFVPTTPPREAARGSALLMIDGGSQSGLTKKPGADAILYGSMLADKIGVPVAVLRQVPNQPLLGDLKEDALIAETFRRFIETKDETWPLLLPMTKAAVRAMDAVGEFSARDLGGKIDRFLVTGGSKRGWTTWLSAAVDPRVVALAPMVIDMLNSKPQMDHQLKVFGAWSDETKDYHALLRLGENDDIRKLWSLVDPFSYREKLTQPKLVILGNNDPYWATDALNIYWEGIPGPKWIHYVPNAGHNLTQTAAGKKIPPMTAINTLGVFTRHHLTGQAMPLLEWKHDDAEGKPRLTAKATVPPKSARLWTANAPTQDFRTATWAERPLKVDGASVTAGVDLPATGSTAFYATFDYEFEGVPYYLCTQLRIVNAPGASAAK